MLGGVALLSCIPSDGSSINPERGNPGCKPAPEGANVSMIPCAVIPLGPALAMTDHPPVSGCPAVPTFAFHTASPLFTPLVCCVGVPVHPGIGVMVVGVNW